MATINNIPIDPSQVTKEWLSTVLNKAKHGYAENIIVNEVIGHKNNGGVLSTVFKARIHVNGAEKQLFIKTMPGPDQSQRVFIDDYALDAREVKTYSTLFEQLEAFEKDFSFNKDNGIKSMVCKYFAGDCCQDKANRGFYVVLEDISDNYQMPNLDKGLNNKQIISALENLAYFHSLTYCYGQKSKTDFCIDYPMAYHSFLEGKDSQEFIATLFKRAKDQLIERNEHKLADILEMLSKDYVSKFKFAYGGQDGRFLTHGDLWCNNLMFNKDDRCILVDWQFTCASTPYLDIASMAFMNQDPDTMDKNMDTFLKAYYEKFEETCQKFDVKGPWNDFEDFKQPAISQGFLSLFVWLLLSFSPCVYSLRILDRFIYIFKKALEQSPNFFETG